MNLLIHINSIISFTCYFYTCVKTTFSVKNNLQIHIRLEYFVEAQDKKRETALLVYMKTILKKSLFHSFNVSVNMKKVK